MSQSHSGTDSRLQNILEKSSSSELVSCLSALFKSNPLKWETIFNQVKCNAVETTNKIKAEQNTLGEHEVKTCSTILCDEINRLRQNPNCYIQHLDDHLEKFKDEYIYCSNTGKIIRTKDGKKGVYDAKSFLESCAKSSDTLLSVSAELEMYCTLDSDYFYDSSSNNYDSNHSFQQRLSNHKNNRGIVVKFAQFGIQDVIDLIVSLLIDDGIPSRCHREFLLNADFKFIGAVYSTHLMYDHIINVALSTMNIFDDNSFLYSASISNIDQYDNQVRSNVLTIPGQGEKIDVLIFTELKDGCVVDYERKKNVVKLTSVKELINGKQIKQIEFNI